MSDLVDAKGRKIRTHFEEVGTDDLWETDEEVSDKILKAPNGDMKDIMLRWEEELTRLKKLTRPRAIQEAEEKASEEYQK